MDNLENIQVTSENAASELHGQGEKSTDMKNTGDEIKQVETVDVLPIIEPMGNSMPQLSPMVEEKAEVPAEPTPANANFDPFTAPLDSMPPLGNQNSSMTPPQIYREAMPNSYAAIPMPEVIQRKKGHAGLIIGIIAALIVAIGALGVLFVPVVNNAAMKTFLSPNKYYQKVEKNYIQKNAKLIGSGYSEAKALYNTKLNASYEGNLKVSFADSFAQKNNIKAFKSAGIDFDGFTKNDLSKCTLGVKVNDQKIVTANTLIDTKKNNLYFQIPELTEKYGIISGESVKESTNDANIAKNIISESSLTGKDIEALINRYSEIIYSSAKNVSIQNNDKGTIDEIGYEYTLLTVKFSGDECKKMAGEILTRMKSDDDMKSIIVSAGKCTADGYKDYLQKGIDSIDNESGDGEMIMRLWVNSNGNIVGREFDFEGGKLGYMTAIKDNKFGLNLWVDADESNLKIDLTGTTKGTKASGSGSINVNDNNKDSKVLFSFKNYEIAKNYDGYASGEFTLLYPENNIKIVADLKGTQKDETAKIGISGKDGDIANIEFYCKQKDGASEDIVIPTENVYDLTKDAKGYTSDIDMVSFYSSIKDKIDVDAISSELQAIFAGGNTDSNAADTEN